VREASVPPKISIVDSEAKPNHIKVRDDGASRSNQPNAFWNLGFVETGSDAEGCHYMRGQ